MHQSYKTFLTTLAGSKSGQTYESLEWAGERLVALEAYKEAEQVLQRVLQEFTQDPQFLQQPSGRNGCSGPGSSWPRPCRGQGKFDEANSLVEELLSQNPRYLEPQFEKGLLLEAEADAESGDWSAVLEALGRTRQKLERMTGPGRFRVLRCLVPCGPGASPSRKRRSRHARRSWASCG